MSAPKYKHNRAHAPATADEQAPANPAADVQSNAAGDAAASDVTLKPEAAPPPASPARAVQADVRAPLQVDDDAPLRTADEVRAWLSKRGMPLSEYAHRYGVPAIAARQVLSGKLQARFGDAHNAAVILGLKHGMLNSAA